ncbi:MAG: undecaprenyl-diphosphate phosphatase [Fastidiosipilaceae bacterium]|jgi:undecaprenyl-diphosphatase|nr:undecaprenyl-diphosphate phosphatase [Clostridiaceae bacterium]
MEGILFVLKSILLGIVEGLSEFLPISSTGHLIIAQSLVNWPNDEFNKMFSVVIQLGAILAVVILFWPKLWHKIKSLFRGEKEGINFFIIWIVGCIPAAIFGVLFNDFIDEKLFSVPTVVAALIVGATLMLLLERFMGRQNRVKSLEEITPKQALVVGLFQCLSLWPGFSRSAATIMGGWAMGFTTSLAAEYSFFLAIPVMFGASGWSMRKFDFSHMFVDQWVALIVGFLVSFLVAFLVVKKFMAFLRTHKLKGFAYYRYIISAVLLFLMFSGVLKV